MLADGGKLVLVGLSGKPVTIADSTTFSTRELRLLGHFGSGAHAVAQLIHLTENGRLDFSRSISDVLPWSRRPKPSNGWSTRRAIRSAWYCAPELPGKAALVARAYVERVLASDPWRPPRGCTASVRAPYGLRS